MSDLTTPPVEEEAGGRAVDEALAQKLVERAREEGVELVGPGGLLADLTKTVLETALEAELEDHLGYPKHAPEGRNKGNSRNGIRSKTVLTDVGEVEIEVPCDREGSFEPQIIRKRQRRLAGVDQMVPHKVVVRAKMILYAAEGRATSRSRGGWRRPPRSLAAGGSGSSRSGWRGSRIVSCPSNDYGPNFRTAVLVTDSSRTVFRRAHAVQCDLGDLVAWSCGSDDACRVGVKPRSATRRCAGTGRAPAPGLVSRAAPATPAVAPARV